MNIFVLDTNPAIAASYHCDQHLHKMFLESAQMLSTAARFHGYNSPFIYRPAHQNHPCSHWVKTSFRFAHWLTSLCYELENIRDSLGYPKHSSIEVIKACSDLMGLENYSDTVDTNEFVFAGPGQFKVLQMYPITKRYQLYYRYKHALWLDTANKMSYKGRPLPPFLSDLSSTIVHSN